MFFTLIRRIACFAIPAAVLVAAWFLAPRIMQLPQARQELVRIAPYLVACSGMLLATHFHRGRPFLVLLLLSASCWFMRHSASSPFEPSLNRVYQAFVLLVPLNLALIAAMRERGMLTVPARVRLLFLGGQALLAYWLFSTRFEHLLPYLARSFFHFSFLDQLLVPQPAMLLGLLCFLVVAILAARRQAPIDCGILGSLAGFFVAANWVTSPHIQSSFFTAATLITVLSVLRDSYNLAFRDDLTGVPSRRALNEGLHGLGRRYTVAMVDVDHFKSFNDSYGHAVGDQVLKMVAAKMAAVGGGGKVYRYGGEEFTILFPGRRSADVLPHLEALREAIAGYRLVLRGADRPADRRQGRGQRGSRNRGDAEHASVTVSIGVAENTDGQSPHEVIKAADRALYKAKNRGRNQVSR